MESIMEKKISVVFQRKKFGEPCDRKGSLSKYGTLEPAFKELMINPKELMINPHLIPPAKEIKNLPELARKKNADNNSLDIMDAIKKQEDKDIEQKKNFVTQVEAMMQKFAEVENLKKIYDSLMDKLPNITNEPEKKPVVPEERTGFLKTGNHKPTNKAIGKHSQIKYQNQTV